ncbi:hypothetical protein [Polaromonas sp.]|uniref:hypothetical protein n=1 Tax=Polaromonas sp. TaxID=1869339 RepID=UPI002734E942|nr:hypothetical protein [Polaromonas sp.]
MNKTFLAQIFGCSLFRFTALVVGLLFALPVLPQRMQQFPTQQSWGYAAQPDISSGDLQPEATLMSRNTLPKPVKTQDTNYGYLSIRNAPGKPLEVRLSVESRQPAYKGLNCQPAGCDISVAFDGKRAVTFRARPAKGWPEAIVLDSSSDFVEAATKNSASIEVQFQDLENGSSRYIFGSSTPLALAKLKK